MSNKIKIYKTPAVTDPVTFEIKHAYYGTFDGKSKSFQTLEEVYNLLGKDNVELIDNTNPQQVDDMVFRLQAIVVINPETFVPSVKFKSNRKLLVANLPEEIQARVAQELGSALIAGKLEFEINLNN